MIIFKKLNASASGKDFTKTLSLKRELLYSKVSLMLERTFQYRKVVSLVSNFFPCTVHTNNK